MRVLVLLLLVPLVVAQGNGTANETADPTEMADPANGTVDAPAGDDGSPAYLGWVVNVAAIAVLLGAFVYVARR